MTTLAQLTDGLVAAINSALSATDHPRLIAPDGQTPVAQRVFVPKLDAKDLEQLAISVVLAGDDATVESRDFQQEIIKIDVGIGQHLPMSADPSDPESNSCLDELTEFARAFKTGVVTRGQNIAGIECTDIKWPLIYDPAKLKNERIFLSIVSFYFTNLADL